MGISINLYVFDREDLMRKLMDLGAKEPLLSKILRECGIVSGGQYIILDNEYYDGASPYYNVSWLIDSAFNIKDSFDIFLDSREKGIDYVEAEETAEKLGITLLDER